MISPMTDEQDNKATLASSNATNNWNNVQFLQSDEVQVCKLVHRKQQLHDT